MTLDASQTLGPAEIALAYHARTRHSPERYASGPETLDWDAQPNPFREFAGSPRTPLPLTSDHLATSLAQIHVPGAVNPAPLTLASVGALLELSMGLSAWKEYGPDRWALRCNPSSGNLHSTEAYVLASDVPGLARGLYHYVSRDHALELRGQHLAAACGPPQFWIGLSSIHWREAWKYGERAFRYCQLDLGHAVGALRYAAAALGWRARIADRLDSRQLAALMGPDRGADFAGAEAEEPELLIAIDGAANGAHPQAGPSPESWTPGTAQWTGRANLLDPHPMYRWPVIGQVNLATQGGATEARPDIVTNLPPLHPTSDARAADILLGRRSAQRFDSKFVMPADVFHRLLDSLLVRPNAPWDVWDFAPRLHPVLFIHRVEGMTPGLYAMPRRPEAATILREAMRPDFEWQRPDHVPAHLPLVQLLPADCRSIAKTISCHQAIAGDGCFSLAMIGEFEPIIRDNAWRYRQLHWEAGLLGHVLYLEAEAAGLRGTGIGCYFDDTLHSLLGIQTPQLRSLYHFTVGRPMIDDRISTLPPYPGRQRNEDVTP